VEKDDACEYCKSRFLLFWQNHSRIQQRYLEVEITKEQRQELVDTLKEKENVVDTSANIKGKILNVHITVVEGTKLDDAKKLTKVITEIIEEEQKKFYDIQVFIDIEGENIDGYPTIGYLGKAETEFKYSSATYEEEEVEE